MPVDFRLLPSRNLIILTFHGVAGLAEAMEAATACARHPDFQPHRRQLVDLRAVTGWERDFPGFMALQAALVEVFDWKRTEAMIVAIAPHRPAQEMAGLVGRSWQGLGGPALRVALDEVQALGLLGLREGSIGELLAGAD